MFRRGKKLKTKDKTKMRIIVSKPGLRLGTSDRTSVSATKPSDALAKQLLDEALAQLAEAQAGQEVVVEIKEDRPEIHHMELMMSLMLLAGKGKYRGVRAPVLFDNKLIFTK